MAVPRPIRLLAAACMALFLFLMVQIMRDPAAISIPGVEEKKTQSFDSFVRDPNLDGRKHQRPARSYYS